jgi:hypothetical protein
MLPIYNPPRTFQILQPKLHSAFTPLENPNPTKSLRPFLRSPRAAHGERIQKWRPRDPTRRMGRRRSRNRCLGGGLTVSAPTTISKNLFLRVCFKTRVLSTGAPLSHGKCRRNRHILPFCRMGSGPPLFLFLPRPSFISTGLSSITST